MTSSAGWKIKSLHLTAGFCTAMCGISFAFSGVLMVFLLMHWIGEFIELPISEVVRLASGSEFNALLMYVASSLSGFIWFEIAMVWGERLLEAQEAEIERLKRMRK